MLSVSHIQIANTFKVKKPYLVADVVNLFFVCLCYTTASPIFAYNTTSSNIRKMFMFTLDLYIQILFDLTSKRTFQIMPHKIEFKLPLLTSVSTDNHRYRTLHVPISIWIIKKKSCHGERNDIVIACLIWCLDPKKAGLDFFLFYFLFLFILSFISFFVVIVSCLLENSVKNWWTIVCGQPYKTCFLYYLLVHIVDVCIAVWMINTWDTRFLNMSWQRWR